MKKFLILLLIIVCTFPLNSSIFVERSVAANGYSLIRFKNSSPKVVYCLVVHNSGYSSFDFYIDQYGTSNWYYEPVGYYSWKCK